MHNLLLCLLLFSASLARAAPHEPLYEYQTTATLNPVDLPVKASGIGFFLAIQSNSGKNVTEDYYYGGENENLGFNVVLGFLNGNELSSTKAMEILVRRDQIVLKPNEIFTDAELKKLKDIGDVLIYKTFEGFKELLSVEEENDKEEIV